MQIMGKRSKILLFSLLTLMLVTLGSSLAAWDSYEAVFAADDDMSTYTNAQVGDVIQFGRYWQKAGATYDDKDPIEWIVVDKNERTGQLTLLSKYILAYGSYFGNWYRNSNGTETDGGTNALVADIPYNQAWSESTARAFLNNLERFDLGGDTFTANEGLSATRTAPVVSNKKLIPSVGFSNARYYTRLSAVDVQALIANSETTGIFKYTDTETYYQRPKITDPAQRLARNGFFDEAFTSDEKQMIVAKEIPGQISHRWPTTSHYLDSTEYVPGTKDKVWVPSVEELNIKAGVDWQLNPQDAWNNPSELESSTTFEYFKNWQKYEPKVTSYSDFVKATHTDFAGQGGSLGNYSIPSWITDIGNNANGHYWTRSAASYWYPHLRFVYSSGQFYVNSSNTSYIGVRPAIILQY